MTLGEFREKTAHLPDNIDIMIYQDDDEFSYSPAEKAEVENVTFKDAFMPASEWAPVECLVITNQN